MNKIIRTLFLIAIILQTKTAATAQISFTEAQVVKDNYFLTLNKNTFLNATITNEIAVLKAATICNNNFLFNYITEYSDDLGFLHKKFNIFYKNIEVVGMDFVLHEKDNKIQYLNGTYENLENINLVASLTENNASQFAKLFFKNKNNSIADNKIKVENVGTCLTKNPLNINSNYFLTYRFIVKSNFVNGMKIYVNAINGNIENYENLSCSVNEPGIAQTRFSGTQNFITDLFNGQYRLRENRNGVNFKTLNATGFFDEIQVINNATDFYDNDNNWTTQETGNLDVATDVHWGMEKTYDYWLIKHNRNSVNNAGLAINSYVNFDEYTDNAYWSYAHNCIFYTAGLYYFSSLTSLDIVAHEYGHGVCRYTSNLGILNGTESQALNEGFSDIWGACVEAYTAPNKQKWLIAEDATIVSPFYLRSMSNPSIGLIHPSSDTYGDANWIAQPDGHYRSGVLNKWFYLLTEGGSGTNGIGNTYNVYGITMGKSERIAYRTELLLGINSNYAAARTLSIQAATELFGTNSCEVKAVTDAWYAVGVGAAYFGTVPFTNTFSTSGVYNTNGSNSTITYSVNPNLQYAYKWYVNGILQNSNTNTCITSSPTYDCNLTTSPQWLENNVITVVICGNSFTCNPIVSICGTAPDPSRRRNINCGFNQPIIPPPCCVAERTNTLAKETDNFNIFPNPSSGEITIKSLDGKKVIKRIIIKDRMGTIVYKNTYNNEQNQRNINLFNKQTDIYMVEIYDGENWSTQKLSLLK